MMTSAQQIFILKEYHQEVILNIYVLIDYVYEIGDNCYPQALLKDCKYAVKLRKACCSSDELDKLDHFDEEIHVH